MNRLFLLCMLLLSSCQIAFQPFPPSVSRAEVQQAFAERDKALLALAQKVEEITPTKKVKK